MDKRHILALLSLIARLGNAAALGQVEPETYCFTYLSTFLELAPLPTATVPLNAIANVVGGTTVTIRATNSMEPDTVSVIGGTTVNVLNAVGQTIANAPGVGTATNIASVRGGTTVNVLNAIEGTATDIPVVIGGTTASTQSVRGGTTVNILNVIEGTATDIPGVIGGTATNIPIAGEGTTVTAIPTVTNAIVPSSAPTPAGANSSSIMFFIVTAPVVTKRGLQKRSYGGFLGNDLTGNRDSCDSASIFTISLGQLLNGDNSTFYIQGDAFREVLNGGTPPADAIIGGFDIIGGSLRFINPGLPNGQANICQVSTGEVYLVFNSTGPDSCQPTILYAYPGESHNYFL
ncbi:hypothetical protein LY76DRAFT_674011 [Colletotrichum caudatum]|nr:hypothetical protein LY76DRAFT_674011 [Colletotrichum caudatum]